MRSEGRREDLLWSRGKPSKAEALSDERPLRAGGRSWLQGNARGGGRGGLIFFLPVVDKMAADPIGAKANGVKCATQLSFVFWMPAKIPELVWPVGKLALPAILAQAILSERSAQFSLVARRGRGGGTGLGGGGGAAQCCGADVTLGEPYVRPGPA